MDSRLDPKDIYYRRQLSIHYPGSQGPKTRHGKGEEEALAH